MRILNDAISSALFTMNLSISPKRELSLEPGLTMFVNDPLLNWLNKNNGKTLFSKSKSSTRSFFKLTYPKKFVRGKFLCEITFAVKCSC